MSIDKIIEELKKVNPYYEVARAEILTAIDDIYNDELYSGYEEELSKLTDEDINRLAWKLNDMDIWEEIYSSAREIIYDELNVSDDE